MQRRDQDRGGEPNPLGHRRRRRERDQVVVVRVDKAADSAQGAEAGLLGPPRPFHKRSSLGVGDRGWQANPNIHDDSSLTLGSTSPGQSTTEQSSGIVTALCHNSSDPSLSSGGIGGYSEDGPRDNHGHQRSTA